MTERSFPCFQIETDQTGTLIINSPESWKHAVDVYRKRGGVGYTADRLKEVKKVMAHDLLRRKKKQPLYFAFWGAGETLREWLKNNNIEL